MTGSVRKMINLIVKTFEGVVKIPYGTNFEQAVAMAKSFGIEHGVAIARIEQI